MELFILIAWAVPVIVALLILDMLKKIHATLKEKSHAKG